MIQVITFDLWNTLIANKSYSEQRLQYFFQFLQESEVFILFDELKNAYDKKFHFTEVTFEEIEFRHIYTIDRIQNVLDEIKIEISEADLYQLKQEFESMMLEDPPELKDGVKKTLEVLAKDYYIGLISNTGVTPGKIISKILEEYNILQYFDLTVYSDETGLFKPHIKMFEIPMEKFNCKPQNAIHIGDLLETDIKGAKDFKMKTIWINDMNSPKPTEIFPDFEIRQISEAIQIIRNLN
jgi:putative hydrolase of the HAD superfamily